MMAARAKRAAAEAATALIARVAKGAEEEISSEESDAAGVAAGPPGAGGAGTQQRRPTKRVPRGKSKALTRTAKRRRRAQQARESETPSETRTESTETYRTKVEIQSTTSKKAALSSMTKDGLPPEWREVNENLTIENVRRVLDAVVVAHSEACVDATLILDRYARLVHAAEGIIDLSRAHRTALLCRTAGFKGTKDSLLEAAITDVVPEDAKRDLLIPYN